MKIVKKDVIKEAGCLQLCTGQEAGSEAAIHAMQEIFNDNQNEVTLLVDAKNAFNRKQYFTILNIYVQNQLRLFTISTLYEEDYLSQVVKRSGHVKDNSGRTNCHGDI